ncbi:hypothetical protein FB45DRAFT_1046401 [Roridomyces roridus]|uniref:CFEM domain-containing protein n=1 Tax=Roridomyces roridus TaxID=1738132 RepID=A0AAD7AY05_9AGAR|nr:hypothetical protein FB45DRAFT_1046401 [Roridomyces roridus]
METCFEEAAGANSCAIDDVHCTCASAQLQEDLTQCLDAECSAFSAPQAQGLLFQLCSKAQVSATGSATPGHLSLSSATPTAPPTGLPSIQNHKSGARALRMCPGTFVGVVATTTLSTPCFDGHCSYDLPASSDDLRLSAVVLPFSDKRHHPSAGWTILDCAKGSMAQDVRLVCTDGSGCPHLSMAQGAVGKLVRLPEDCGRAPFALVTRDWVHQNQTLPAELVRKLRRRDGDGAALPPVKGLSIDANFSGPAVGSAGPVNFALHGLTGSVPTLPTPQRRSRFLHNRRRGQQHQRKEVMDRSLVSVLQQAFQEFNSFNQSTMQKLKGVDIKETFPLFDEKVSCPARGKIPAFEASVSGSVDACMVANATLAMTAVGTLMPPNFTKFGIVVGLDANLEGTLTISGSASVRSVLGDLDSEQLNSSQSAYLDWISLASSQSAPSSRSRPRRPQRRSRYGSDRGPVYCISTRNSSFPPDPFTNSSGKIQPNNSPLNFSVSPDFSSSATLEAHIIPTLDFGIDAIGGLATADIFVDFDTSSTLTLTLDGSASASGNVSSSGVDVAQKSTSGLEGCVDIGAGLAINAGVQGSFFGLFDFMPQANLYQEFRLF